MVVLMLPVLEEQDPARLAPGESMLSGLHNATSSLCALVIFPEYAETQRALLRLEPYA